MARQTQMPSFNKQRHPRPFNPESVQWAAKQSQTSQASSPLQVHKSRKATRAARSWLRPQGAPWVIEQAGPPHPSPVHISNSTFTVSEIRHGQDLHFLKAQNCLGKAQNCVL